MEFTLKNVDILVKLLWSKVSHSVRHFQGLFQSTFYKKVAWVARKPYQGILTFGSLWPTAQLTPTGFSPFLWSVGCGSHSKQFWMFKQLQHRWSSRAGFSSPHFHWFLIKQGVFWLIPFPYADLDYNPNHAKLLDSFCGTF